MAQHFRTFYWFYKINGLRKFARHGWRHKGKRLGIKRIIDVKDAKDFMNIFQTFYQLTGCLPLSNGLLVIPEGDSPPGEKRVNMKSLYDMFKHSNSHGLVSLPFLGILQYYLEKNDFSMIQDALTELYSNL